MSFFRRKKKKEESSSNVEERIEQIIGGKVNLLKSQEKGIFTKSCGCKHYTVIEYPIKSVNNQIVSDPLIEWFILCKIHQNEIFGDQGVFDREIKK